MAEEKLIKLVSTIANNIVRGVVSQEKLQEFVRAIVTAFKDFREKCIGLIDGLTEKVNKLSKQIDTATEIVERETAKAEKLVTNIKEKVSGLERTVAEVKRAMPSEFDPSDLQREMERIRTQIPKIPDIPKSFDATEIMMQLGRIAKELKQLDDKIREVRQIRSSRGGGGMSRAGIKEIDISSQLDGVTKTFNLGAFYRILSVDLSSFPHALRKQTDYTYDSDAGTITMTSEIDAAVSLDTGQTGIVTVVTA